MIKNLITYFLLLIISCSYVVSQDSKAPKEDPKPAKIENWGTEEDGQKLLESIKKKFEPFIHRYPGSKGNELMSQFIESEFSRIAGKENVGVIEFRQPVFLPGVFFLESSKGEKIQLYSLEPNYVDLSNFEKGDFSGNLLYAGEGLLKEINGKDLTNSIVLMSFNSGDRWQEMVPFGAQAIIFLENEKTSSAETDAKISDAPLTMPRFLVKLEDQEKLKSILGDDLSDIAPVKIVVEQNNRWGNKGDNKNHWAYIKGKNDKRVLIIGTHYDTNGIVPDLSVNASDDVNLALQLEIMENFAKEQPSISVLFVAMNGYYRGMHGPTEFFWYSSVKDEYINQEIDFYQKRKNLYQAISEYYGSYSQDKLDEMRNATTTINNRNLTWKKSLIDLLRGEQNKASENIMNLTYSMKKSIDEKDDALKKIEELKGLDPNELKQISIIKNGQTEKISGEDLQSLQSDIFSKDYVLNKLIEELKSLDEKTLLLTRNFAKEDNEKKVNNIHQEFEDKYKLFESSLSERNALAKKLIELATAGGKQNEIDALQNLIIKLQEKYFNSTIELYHNKKNKNDSITLQKLFNSSFAEQLFIKAKEGENRKLIDSSYEEKIKKYFELISAKALGYSKAAQFELDLINKNSSIRKWMYEKSEGSVGPRGVLFLDLNLTFNSDQFGLLTDLSIGMNGADPITYSRSAPGEFKAAGKFIGNAVNLAKNLIKSNSSDGTIKKNCLVDTTTTNKFNQFVLRNSVTCNGEAKTCGIPALTIITTEDRSNLNNTTKNNYETINLQCLINQWRYLLGYIPLLTNESDFILNSLKPYDNSYSSYVFNFVQQDNLAISVPETPVEDVLFVFGNQPTSPIAGLGARTYHGSGYFDRKIYMANSMGTVSVRNIRKLGVYGFEAFKFDKDFISINNVMDMRKGSKTFKIDLLNVTDDFKDYTVAVFPCEKIDLYGIFDYEKMTRYNSVKILDGLQNSMPDNICVSGMPIQGGHSWVRAPRVNGGFTVFKKIDATIKLILENKILINSKEKPSENSTESEIKKLAIGVGYNRESLHRRSIAWESFKDAKKLNHFRNDILSSKGVKESLVIELNKNSESYLEKSKIALDKKDYTSFFRNMYSGFGMTYASYPKVLQVMNDMIKAVVFYLALVIPFSFFIQRLCFPVTSIERQLGFNALVFIATFMAFRYVHPAFELTDAPIIVLIAFIQIVLAIFVFNVLYNKFDARIKIIQGRTNSGDSASSNILSQALIIGVNNMRKRKIRTVLTCVTIILVTFTMLSFTSISSTVDPTMRRTEIKPPYSGIFYAKNSWSPLYPDNFVQAFPNHTSSVRRAWFNRKSAPFNIQYPNSGNTYPLLTFLGLEKNEEGFLGKLPISGRFFSSDDAQEVILSNSMAEVLKIDPNNFVEQEVLIMGEKFKLIGFFDQNRIEELKDIRGTSILPQSPVGKAPSASDQLELDESESDGNNNYRSMNAKMMGIMPYRTTLKMGGYCVSISLKYDSIDKMWEDTRNFTTFSRENIYLSTQENLYTDKEAPPIRPGVFFIGNGFSTSIGGLADLIIPLIISATIIMNTMLGTVYERKKEIEIYTAVGLNPNQIGLFFIAEALVYGIIGSVAGYLIGQGVSKIMYKYQLLMGINLNFSSLLVVYVMVCTILIVIVSTIYPAFTAVKAAQPSGESNQDSKLKIENDTIEILYPFSFTETKRYAINGFIREYILKFADASTGSFMSRPISVGEVEHYDAKTNFTTVGALVQRFDIALTPYDLGVTEEVELVTFYHPKVNAYMVKMVIHRVSGTDSNWLRTNQPFSDEIRKLMLRWRVEPLAVQDKCQIAGEALFNVDKKLVSVGEG